MQIPDTALKIRDFANRKKVSRQAVEKRIRKGHLPKSTAKDERGRTWIVDVDLADREWAANGDYTDAPQREPDPVDGTPAENGATVSSAAERQKHWAAKLAELKYKEASGELIQKRAVVLKWADKLSAMRTKLLGMPSHIKQAIPSLSVQEIAKIEQLIRDALTEIADD